MSVQPRAASPLLSNAISRDYSPLFDRLLAMVCSVSAWEIAGAHFVRMPGGYDRAVLERPGEVELALLRWPAGSLSQLHGHGDSAALLWLRVGRMIEDAFVPSGGSYAHTHAELGAGGIHTLASGTYHRVEVPEASFGIHVYAPRPSNPIETVEPGVLRQLAGAWSRANGGVLPDWLRS